MQKSNDIDADYLRDLATASDPDLGDRFVSELELFFRDWSEEHYDRFRDLAHFAASDTATDSEREELDDLVDDIRLFRAVYDRAIEGDRHVIRDGKSGAPKIAFIGRETAGVSSDRPESDRWTELALFRTVDQSWVAREVGKSALPHETDLVTVHEAATDAELVDALGNGPLARDLYSRALVVQHTGE